MDPWWIERFALIAFLLMCSALFSGSETALFSLSRVTREALARRVDRRSQAVLWLLSQPRRLIVTIILCNELVNVAISALLAGSVERWWTAGQRHHLWTTLITVGIAVPLLVLFGELTPKTLAIRLGERWALALGRPLKGLSYIVAPLRVVPRVVSEAVLRILGYPAEVRSTDIHEAEFRALVDVGEAEGEVEGSERTLIHNVFEFGDRTVGEVMTPAEKVFRLPYGMPLGRLVEAVAASRFSRVPIEGAAKRAPRADAVKGQSREIVGVVYAKDLVGYAWGHLEGHTIHDLLHAPFFVPRSTKCDHLFREFKHRKIHMALVVDEYGGLAGLVTMEDLLEELFGEIVDDKEGPRT